MSTTIDPVFFTTKETDGYTDNLAKMIKDAVGNDDAEYLLNHPVVYIHVWRSKKDVEEGKWSIYIGEANDLIRRTKEHWTEAKNPSKEGAWQVNMVGDLETDENGQKIVPTVYFFGHKLFHKSLTLDIENKLIDYCFAMDTTRIQNGRSNAQGSYAGEEHFDSIFSKIWKILNRQNEELFVPEYLIIKSAIYKASPNHKLTQEKKEAKQFIIDRTVDAFQSGKKNQLIFVEGGAGTGKTVLTSTTFFEMLDNESEQSQKLDCRLLINHKEQLALYQNMAKKLGHKEDIIQLATTFLKDDRSILDSNNNYIPDDKKIADIVFVDEAHLLWNQNNQYFDRKFKNPQLDEIIDRSKITVIMFDEYQVLHKGQIFDPNYMKKKRKFSQEQGNYTQLNIQLRMNCAKPTREWIDGLTEKLKVNSLQLGNNCQDKNHYTIKVFDTPQELQEEIIKKAKKDESHLSRLIATQDWEYRNEEDCNEKKLLGVKIGDFFAPWNEQKFHKEIKSDPNTSKQQKQKYNNLNWAEKDYSINEVGTTFTIQGFDLAYAGVILGPSVKYNKDTKEIWFDEKERALPYMKGNRTMQDGTKVNVTNIISRNELRVLLTRGSKGLYIYACDKDLREALKKAIKKG